jgi:hypothetical protein
MTNISNSQPDPTEAALLRRLVGGDPAAEAEAIDALAETTSASVLVAGSVLTGSSAPLARATGLATTARDRQLVVLARAHVEGAAELFDALIRDHLASYPDHLLAAWIATRTR